MSADVGRRWAMLGRLLAITLGIAGFWLVLTYLARGLP